VADGRAHVTVEDVRLRGVPGRARIGF
jgi:hypothetical protein